MSDLTTRLRNWDTTAGKISRMCLEAADEIDRMNGHDKKLRKKYNDLIYQVETKHPGESRHETAKRYIHEHENQPQK